MPHDGAKLLSARAMRSALALALLAARLAYAQDDSSSKRGLVYVDKEDASDDRFWNSDDTDLTWYYNWSPNPTGALRNGPLEFVPMQWGEDGADGFYDNVKSQLDGGSDITYVLGFNEPDGCDYGGSCVDAETAAGIWIDQIEPLKELGLTLGSPSVTGSQRGMEWMQDFFTECAGRCSPDFFAAHWYGNFEGLASYLGQVNATYPNMTLWVTEFAYPEMDLEESQAFFNQSTEYFDRLP